MGIRHVMGALVALAIGAGAPVWAQVQPPQDRIDTALARAIEVGIPVSLLESKIAEGKAKGVPIDRIAAAVERRQAALESARDALKGQEDVSVMDLGVAADAVESGVSDVVLRAVAESAQRERRAVAIATLTHLVRIGHVPEAALDRVRDALARGPQALLNLPAEAARAAGRGGAPPAGTGPAAPETPRAGGPPAAVPAPGGASQPSRPDDKRPAAPGPPASPPGRGRP